MVLIQLDRDTGQHPRMARWFEDQTGVGLGRDEKDVGVRSFKLWCGREKVARLAAAAGADKTSRGVPQLHFWFVGAPRWAALILEWYTRLLELSSNLTEL